MPTLEPRSRHSQGPERHLGDGSGPPARRPDLVARLCLGLAIVGALIGLVGFVALSESAALTVSRVVTGAALLIWLAAKVVRRRRPAATGSPR